MKQLYTVDEFEQILECINSNFPLVKIYYDSNPHYVIFSPGESLFFTITKNGMYKILDASYGVRNCLF